MDASLSFSNMATQICVRMGLHRPAYSAEFDRVSAVHDPVNVPSRIAWIFCFVSNIRWVYQCCIDNYMIING